MSAMKFASPSQHSLFQIANIKNIVLKGKMPVDQAIFVAIELTQHGFPEASGIISGLQKQVKNPEASEFFGNLLKQSHFISLIPNWDAIRREEDLIKSLYKLNGYYFSGGDIYPEKLIVVFTTMYNNFYISNAVLFAFLSQFGVSILILKDATRFNYLNGVEGFGLDPSGIAKEIKSLASSENIKEIYITGFSSGGYGSLLCSCLIPCNGYLGFSISSDLSRNSLLVPGKFFTEDVSSKIPDNWLLDLREFVIDHASSCNRTVFYGAKYKHDVAHAKHLIGIPNLTLHELENCGHITVGALMESGELTGVFRRFIFDNN
jgi:hypothetical protein